MPGWSILGIPADCNLQNSCACLSESVRLGFNLISDDQLCGLAARHRSALATTQTKARQNRVEVSIATASRRRSSAIGDTIGQWSELPAPIVPLVVAPECLSRPRHLHPSRHPASSRRSSLVASIADRSPPSSTKCDRFDGHHRTAHAALATSTPNLITCQCPQSHRVIQLWFRCHLYIFILLDASPSRLL